MNFYLINPLKLNPIEAYSKKEVDWLSKNYIWLLVKPIAITEEHNLVMDGHHRLECSLKLGLLRVPCFIFLTMILISIHGVYWSIWDNNKKLHGIKNISIKQLNMNCKPKFKPISIKKLN